jgi:hypothetical protein
MPYGKPIKIRRYLSRPAGPVDYHLPITIYQLPITNLYQTKPISEMPKMVVTAVMTMTNNNEQPTMNYSKQTQSNPILSAVALAKERT